MKAFVITLSIVLGAMVVVGCSDDDGTLTDAAPDAPAQDAAPARFPDDYQVSYTEVRNCRRSTEHNSHYIRVWADAQALMSYQDRATPFPDGAVVLKEEFDIGDVTCASDPIGWTVMVKNAAATERLGWDWQNVNAERVVVGQNQSPCIGCHEACSGPPTLGYDYTCTDP